MASPRTVLLSAAPGIPLLGPSGASAHLRGVAEALRPHAVVTARRADHRGIHGAVSVPVVELGVPAWPSWLGSWREYNEIRLARRIARAAISLEPQLVWERHSLYSDAGWKVHAATGARLVLEVNAPLVEERRRYEGIKLRSLSEQWEREVLLAAPEIIAVSGWLASWLRSLGCRNVRHVPNGVSPRRGDREAARKRLGLEGKFVIGFLGSMKPWHGVEELPRLLDQIPDAVGLSVGAGPVAVSHERLRCMGQVDEAQTADLVAAMDIGLAPYAPDAPPWFCPLKILAYRAQGTPVVAADIGDCRLLTGDGGTVGPEFVGAIEAWRGKRAPAWVRSWATVVDEALAVG